MDIFKTLLLDTPVSTSISGTVPVNQGGTGATNATDARTNLGAAASGANADITSMTGITGGLSSPDFVQFDTGATVTPTVGRLWWGTTGTLNVHVDSGGFTSQLNEQIMVYGKASAAITKGQLVMKTGVVGASGVITFGPSTAGITDGNAFVGVAFEDIALNGFGRVIAMGKVSGLNTSAYLDNDTLWYDPAGSGAMTATKPTAPNIKAEIGIVINAGSGSSGSIYVKIFPGSQLGGTDQNVQLTSPTNNDFLVYDGGDKRWENYSASSAKTAIGLGNVENTALSTWAGSTNITTIGTISTGTVPAANVSGLATVATSGKYSDLTGLPTLGTISSQNANNVTISGGSINGTTIGASSASTGAFTTLSASSTVSGTGFSTYLASPPAIGSTAANTGAFTTLSASSTVSGTGFTNYFASPPSIGSTAANTGAFTTLSASSTVSGTGFSTYLASPPAIGGTAPAAGKFTTLEATGVATVTAGTVSAPAITTSGDTNTGIFFPAADAIAFTEGGAEVFRIESNGRMGIGQTSPASKLDLSGNYASNITAVSALDIDCSTANYFTKTINANSTFTFSSVPASRAYAFALELTHTSGTITWPTTVKWPKDTAPTLTTGRTHIFIFVTDDGGTRWRGASLVDYVN